MSGHLNPHHPPYTNITDTMPSSSSGEFTDDHHDDYKIQPTVEEECAREQASPLSDDDRLRMLGYDVSLGRSFGFWSSAGLNVSHNSFIYEFIAYQSIYAHNGPLLFVIGYPFLIFFHLCLIGPFSELVSTFPVAGGMATWAWQLARAGIGGERQWGWVVAGFTLAMHLGKTISYLFGVTTSLTAIYVSMSGKKFNTLTGLALEPEQWWEPVFYLSLVAFVAILTITRVARTGWFWIGAGVFNVILIILVYAMLITCAVKIPKNPGFVIMKENHGPKNWGFPLRKNWIYGFSRMIFMGLPLRVTAVDAPIHMAEETRHPSRTVPRVLWTTTIFHHVNIYATVIMYMLIVTPITLGLGALFPIVPMGELMEIGKSGILGIAIIAALSTITQVLASTLITSRFIFALARDKGIPFSKLMATTDKHKEPWVAMVALLLAMFLSTTGWLVNHNNYTSLLHAFHFYFINVPYVLPLILYVFSGLDLRYIGRSEFSLGKISKPCACVAIAWLILSLIQGSMPLTEFNGTAMFREHKKGEQIISWLPMTIGGMLVVILASWFLYGRHHYVGPIRAITIWATGQDIDPRNVSTANARGLAIRRYIEKKTGKTSSNGESSSGGPSSRRPTFSGPRTATLPTVPAKSPTLQRFFGRGSTSSGSRGTSSGVFTESTPHGQPLVSVLPESGVLPQETRMDYEVTRGGMSVLPESGLFPESVIDERSTTSAAQAESQLLPAPPVSNRVSRRMNFRPSVLKIGEQSYPLTQLTPPPRSPPTQTPLSPPPRTRNSLQYSSSPMPTQMEAAQEESQLEPELDSRFSFAQMPALEESQIHPGGSRDSFGVKNHEYSSHDHPRDAESFIEPSALAESQLEPRRW
ncbi:hypothetical protein CC85DRAFT_284014 [Cutaneotrichosporon oleaginosum]|uniref:Amino acid transporter n=1 Tax=Cutaneotrichosporon oleaginosum TaxID=879819 RepID=A0A0J0XSB8_9TREE|nr:uncharacterized protein CC85DRAFT_284014 [Cutaneotrichosporon oleaginosum]KLT43973.1 hypothetical protein CC85DRAFT_284014 [Cutaneotrichosporon oleaginosum]TXT04079.1 hypothetical protein COLE_07776 [Cutaneotrichosporon oleaginosum]